MTTQPFYLGNTGNGSARHASLESRPAAKALCGVKVWPAYWKYSFPPAPVHVTCRKCNRAAEKLWAESH